LFWATGRGPTVLDFVFGAMALSRYKAASRGAWD
jgi:hypothetical protein